MKKRALIKQLRPIPREAGVESLFIHQGGNHEIWRISNRLLVIPRHRDINERTAEGIVRRVEEVIFT